MSARAERDLEWFFNVGTSALGLSAQAYDSGGGGSVWDDRRIDGLHEAMSTRAGDVARYGRIVAVVEALKPATSRVVLARFTPYPWDSALRVELKATTGNGTLAGVALLTSAAVEAFRRAHPGREAYRDVLRDWLACEARSARRVATLKPIATEARRMLAEALGAYEAIARSGGAW